MANIQSNNTYNNFQDIYTNQYNYNKNAQHITDKPSDETYRGTIEVPSGFTQLADQEYPLIHAKDIQIGNNESDRLTTKLEHIDQILRDIYGRTPTELEALDDGRSTEVLAALAEDNGAVGSLGSTGIQSLSRVAAILNDRTETIDDRIKDLKIIKTMVIDGETNKDVDSVSSDDSIGTEPLIADHNSDTITIKNSNKWIRLNPDPTNDTFTIGHLVTDIPNSERTAASDSVETRHKGTYDFNDLADTTRSFDVDTLEYDNAGHITKYHKHTYTLPDSFKYVTIGAESAATINGNAVADTCTADLLVDTVTMNPSNKWIRLAADKNADIITIGHIVSPIAVSTSDSDLNSNSSNTVDAQTVTYDEAGHIISTNTHTYTLPYGFKFIKVNAQSTAVNNDVSAIAGTCTADNTQDSLTLYTGNKWINIAANRAGTNDSTDKSVTFSHIVSPLTAGAHNLSYSLENTIPKFGDNITIVNPSLSFTTDEAGHVTAYTNNASTVTVTLPVPAITTTSTDQIVTGINKVETAGNNNGTFIYTKANIGTFAITGYAQGADSSKLEATDSLNIALGKIQCQIDAATSRLSTIEDWKINGSPITNSTLLNGGNLPMSSTDNTTIKAAIEAESAARENAGYLTQHQSIDDIITSIEALKDSEDSDDIAVLNRLKAALGIITE